MNRIIRLITVFTTSLAVACTGRGCSESSHSPSVVATSLDRQSQDNSLVVTSGSKAPIEELRLPLLEAQQNLSNVLGVKSDPQQLTTADLANRLENLFTEIEAANRRLPRDTFDVEALAMQLGTDQVRLFDWVRDNTYLVPYVGVLRGPIGVLMDRRGNSLDRALLLGELLRSGGARVRLARAALSRKQAVAISESIARSAPKHQALSSGAETQPTSTGVVDRYAKTYGVDVAQLHDAVKRISTASSQVTRLFEQRVKGQAAEIAKMLVKPANSTTAKVEDDLKALQDHWWVQVQQDAKWIDLDPAISNATPGQTLTAATEVFDATKLPENLFHYVTIRVIVEQRSAGGVQEWMALEQRLRPLELLGQRIALHNRPLNAPNVPNLSGDQGKASLENFLLAQKEWLPVLSVGTKEFSQSSFTELGNVNDTPGSGFQSVPAGNAFGGLAGAFGGETEESVEPDGSLTAEWIEYEIRTPGRAPEKIRRDVFDLLGPAARSGGPIGDPLVTNPLKLRRAMALLEETDILLLVSQLPQEFIQHVMYTSLLGQRETLRSILKASADKNMDALVELVGRLALPSGELYNLAFARIL